MADGVVGNVQVMAGLVRCGMRVHGAWGSGGAPQTRVTHFQDGQWAQTKPCMAASRSASAFALGKQTKIKLFRHTHASLAAARSYDHTP